MALRDILILVLLSLAIYLPGISAVPPMDRDEARFAQASKQMLETGDWIDIRFQDQARHKKPAGSYWLQASSTAVFGKGQTDEIWTYRLPSTLGALIAVLATYALGTLLFGRQAGLIAGALLAASLSLTVEAHLAKTDALLLASVASAQLFLARVYQCRNDPTARPRFSPWLFWAALGIGILLKGPIAPMIVALTIIVLVVLGREWRWLGRLRPLGGLLLMLAIALPWFVAIEIKTGGFLAKAIGGDMLPKLMGGAESHGMPPGYYLATIWLMFWPGSLFLVPALVGAWRARAEPAVLFLAAWVIPTWVILEVVPTKLPHYSLPLFPALAILVAAALTNREGPIGRSIDATWTRVQAYPWTLIGIALAIGLVGVKQRFGDGLDSWTVAAAIIAIAVAVQPLWLLRRGMTQVALVVVVIGAVLIHAIAFQYILPSLDGLSVSRSLAQKMQALDPNGTATIAASGYREPSLVFLLGTQTRLSAPEEAADILAREPGAIALIEARNADAFRARAQSLGIKLEAVDTVNGLNYSNGKTVAITIHRAEASQ